MNKTGADKKRQKTWDDKDMNTLYVKYQELRWIIVDEASSASVEILATMEWNMRQSTRKQHSWAVRRDGSERPFGGRNLGLCGDWWQFGPVASLALFDNPFKGKHSSAEQRILAMVWTKSQIR